MRRNPRAVLVPGALVVLLLAGCVVGPNYKGPPAPSALERPLAGPGVLAGPPAARWWLAFGDPLLNRLLETALARSITLEAGRARVLEARAALTKAKADALPSTQAAGVYLRTKGLTNFLTGEAATGQAGPAAGAAASNLEFYDVGFDATWELDLFGAAARGREAAKALAEARLADLEDAKVSLSAEIVRTYVALRDSQTRAVLAAESARLSEESLAASLARRAGGTGADLDLERLRSQALAARARIDALEGDVAEAMNRLAVLVGETPGALDAELLAPSRTPQPPAVVNVGDPAGLLRRRPDLRAAERNLARQNALIGQRTADYFPKVELLGNIGFGASDAADLLRPGSFSYAAAPVLQWRPFDFGRTKALVAQARFARQEAEASYRQKALEVLEDAATGVARYGRDRQVVRTLEAQEASAARAATLTWIRVQGGTATISDDLDAKLRLTDVRSDLASARARLTEDFVALQKSLGLGWDGA
jgi:NodT family efflux transporter outer membrane factor (OMF) lipoprotein